MLATRATPATTVTTKRQVQRNMHGLKILLAIAAFALGSAASATLPTSAAGDPQQAEYAPDTTTDPFSAANDYTGTYIHMLGLSNAKTKQNLIFKLK